MGKVPMYMYYKSVKNGGGVRRLPLEITRERARYRGTSLIRNIPLVGPYSSPIPRNLW